MAKLLRLHLSCVGHKDARFFPLSLDFRDRDGQPTDCVIWLMNGGGKSSLMNLFYSTFQPETRKFLGAKAESRERRLADYVKAGDLAVIVTEWQMPVGKNLFSPTRIVGQVLAWRGGMATPADETRLEREFFTFRGSETLTFDSLPFHGLNHQPLSNITAVRDWLAHLSAEYPASEVERSDQSRKGRWREILNRVGIDTELFSYNLKMNVREGGAAALFAVRDTMEFIDLFLEMAFNPDQAEKTREQIEAVREKLIRLPQIELEERFALALLEQLRPLIDESNVADTAEREWRQQLRTNYTLRTAIEGSIKATQIRHSELSAQVSTLRETQAETTKQKLRLQEYALNYRNLARELTFREAQRSLENARANLHNATSAKNLAAAGIRFARISARQIQVEELMKARESELLEAKPVLDDLHALGAAYAAAITAELNRIAELHTVAAGALTADGHAHSAAQQVLLELRTNHTRTNSELDGVKARLIQRDKKRAGLRDEGFLLPDEPAADALIRWRLEQEGIETAISHAETRIDEIDGHLAEIAERIHELETRCTNRRTDALDKDRAWQRGMRRLVVCGRESPSAKYSERILLNSTSPSFRPSFMNGDANSRRSSSKDDSIALMMNARYRASTGNACFLRHVKSS